MYRYLPLLAIFVAACGPGKNYGDPPDAPTDAFETDTFEEDDDPAGCGFDDHEPNDDLQEATPFSGTQRGLSVHADRDDWFAVSVGSASTLQVEVEFSHQDGDITLQLLDELGTNIVASATKNDKESVRFVNLDAGRRLYVRVAVEDTACNNYDLTVKDVALPPEDCGDGIDNDGDGQIDCLDYECVTRDATCMAMCPEDGHEPNDAQTSAVGLTSDTNLMVHYNNVDWWAIDVPANTLTTVQLDFVHADGDIDLEIHNAAGYVSGSYGTEDGETASVGHDQTTTQTFFAMVELFGSSGVCNTYDFAVTHETAPACSEDADEPNDVQAAAITSTGGTNLAVTSTSDDWWAIDVPANMAVQVDASFENKWGNLDLELYDATGASLDLSWSDGNSEMLFWANRSGTAQTVYVLAYLYQGLACQTYDMAVTQIPVPPCNEDTANEPNDTQATAIVSGSATSLTVTDTSDDWWQMDVPANTALEVEFDFNHRWGNIDVELYDSNGVEIDYSWNDSSRESLIHVNRTGASETVFAYVYLYSGGTCQTYDMTVTTTAVPTCTEDTSNEPNDTQATAIALTTGTNLAVTDTSDDWWDITVPANSVARIHTQFDHRFGNIDLELYDSLGYLDAVYSYTDDERMSFVNDTANPATVALWVNVSDSPCQTYDYDVTTEAIPTCAEDANEPNNELATATALTSATDLAVLAGDDDWLAFDVAAEGSAMVMLQFIDPLGDIDLEIYDVNGNWIDGSYGVSDIEQVEVYNGGTATATYYARVELYDTSAACNLYDFEVFTP